MKIIIAFLICILLISASPLNAFAQNDSEATSHELDTEHPVPEVTENAKPQWEVINGINVTFFVVNGRAYASYYVSSQVNGITVKVQMEKGAIFPKNFGEPKTEKTTKKYLSGSYSLPVGESGTYWVYISVSSGDTTQYKEVKFVYNADILRGDANRDGVLRANDARLILRFSAELEKFDKGQKTLCDINKDNYITAADARLALNMSAMLI